jgi:hypothetical protein
VDEVDVINFLNTIEKEGALGRMVERWFREGSRGGPPRAKSGARPLGVWTRSALGAALALGLLLASSPAMSQATGGRFTVIDTNIQKRVNGMIALMQYSLVPEVTTSSLSISSGTTGESGLGLTQLGGGFTWSQSFPLYLEGNAALSRYDPTFIASDGTVTREIPVKMTSLAGTVGIGWDFPVARELKLRPIANFTLGQVMSDLSAAGRLIEAETGKETKFLDVGRLNAVGYGGSLMLDYEHYRKTYEIDVEIRLTHIYLQSISGTSEGVQGSALAQSVGLWSRWRAPTGLQALDRPVRYVLEAAYSYYFGPDGDMLGFNHLSSLGAGLELDISAYDLIATRLRLIGRYRFGENVTGWTIGLGISF